MDRTVHLFIWHVAWLLRYTGTGDDLFYPHSWTIAEIVTKKGTGGSTGSRGASSDPSVIMMMSGVHGFTACALNDAIAACFEGCDHPHLVLTQLGAFVLAACDIGPLSARSCHPPPRWHVPPPTSVPHVPGIVQMFMSRHTWQELHII